MRNRSKPLFHRGHHNVIQGQILTSLLDTWPNSNEMSLHGYSTESVHRFSDRLLGRNAVIVVAVRLANRFKQDDPNFDPVEWLNGCSPDADQYPLGELYTEELDGE